MDFSLNEEQRGWQIKARKFALEELRPMSLRRDRITGPDASVRKQTATELMPVLAAAPTVNKRQAAGVLIVALLAAQWCHAQPYPARPIRVIVPAAAGGAGDITARAIGQKLTGSWGQQVIVDNRSGIVGTEIVARGVPAGPRASSVPA